MFKSAVSVTWCVNTFGYGRTEVSGLVLVEKMTDSHEIKSTPEHTWCCVFAHLDPWHRYYHSILVIDIVVRYENKQRRKNR